MQNRQTLIRIVLIALMGYAILNFASARAELGRTEETVQALRAEYEDLMAENRLLTQRLVAGGDDETIETLARQRLGLVLPGEKVFYFTKDRED